MDKAFPLFSDNCDNILLPTDDPFTIYKRNVSYRSIVVSFFKLHISTSPFLWTPSIDKCIHIIMDRRVNASKLIKLSKA